MPTATPYFLYPFATSGNATSIDLTGAGNTGEVTYQYGFTPNYELDLNTESDALPVPRPQFNQLMFDITSAIQYLQLHGSPLWIAAADGGPPNPPGYPLYARVGYNPGDGFRVWESQVVDNVSVPGANADWLPISGAVVVQPGTVIEWASPYAPAGYLRCDSTPASRVTYVTLYNQLTQVMACSTGNGSTTLTVPSTAGLATGTLANLEGTGIQAGTYIAAILSGTTLQMSLPANASGSPSVRFFFHGNGNGSTTFNVPNLSRKVVTGVGGTGNSFLGALLGQTGGADNYKQLPSDLAFHSHPDSEIQIFGTGGGGTFATPQNINLRPTTKFSVNPSPTGITAAQQTSMNVIQQSTNLYKYIKY